MRSLPGWLAATAAVTALGCSQGSGPLQPTAASVPNAALGGVLQEGSHLQAALGIYRVEVDPDSLQATVALLEQRSGQANDDLYLLPIDNFLRPNSLRVTGVRSTIDTLLVDYVITHPFNGPTNLDGAATAANRADLGVAGFALFLMDVPSASGNTYFGDRVANTSTILNADAYWAPGGLLQLSTTANLFPYKLFVDESGADGNRVGISNGGDSRGNYGGDGWTRGNIGFSNNGWTGYGVLHQGQSAANTVELAKAGLTSFSFDVALVAKYNDPRGGTTSAEKRANRLPPVLPDFTRFAYRMPHGALDVQKITFLGSSDLYVTGSLSTSTLAFHVEDWDARAAETFLGDLSDDPVLSNVAAGEAGLPTVSVCIPGVTGTPADVVNFAPGVLDDDSPYGGDAAEDSGRPDDALCYADAVNSIPAGPDTAGTYTGLVRVTDPELTQISDPNFIVELDGNLQPVSVNIPEPVTYQVFTVEVQTPVVDQGFAVTFGGVGSEEARAFTIGPDGSLYVGGRFTQSLNFGGGVRSTTGSSDYDCFILKLDPQGNYVWDRTFGGPSTGIVERVDGLATDSLGNLYAAGWIRGPADLGGGTVTTTGFTDIFLAKYSPSGTLLWSRNFGPATTSNSAEAYAVAVDPTTNDVYVAGQYYATITPTGGSPMTSLGSSDAFLVKYTSTGGFLWQKSVGSPDTSGLSDAAENVAVDSAGNVYIGGRCSSTVDFGGGSTFPGGSFDGWIAKYASTGAYIWDKRYNSTAADWVYCITPTTGNDIVVSGFFNTNINLGGGIRNSLGASDGFIARYNAGGTWQWDRTFGSTGGDWMRFHDVDDTTGEVYLVMDYSTGANFGGGPRTVVGSRDVAMVKLDAAGNYVWDTVWGGTGTDFSWKMKLDPNNNPVCAGYFNGTVDFEPGPGVTNLTSNGSSDIFVQKLLKATGMW